MIDRHIPMSVEHAKSLVDKLEGGTIGAPVDYNGQGCIVIDPLFSIAMSLKRIADAVTGDDSSSGIKDMLWDFVQWNLHGQK